MKVNWRGIAKIGAQVAQAVGVPQAVAIEDQIEGSISAKTGPEKAQIALEAGLHILEAEAALTGKSFATPRVELAIRGLNDAGVELMNALAAAKEAAAAKPLA